MGSDLYLEQLYNRGPSIDTGAFYRDGWRAGIDTAIKNYLRLAGDKADDTILARFEELRQNPPKE